MVLALIASELTNPNTDNALKSKVTKFNLGNDFIVVCFSNADNVDDNIYAYP